MKPLLLRLGAFLATFVFAAGTNCVINRVYPRFENVAMGSMVFPPDGRGGFTSYRSRDGVDLVFEQYAFPSPEAASAAFHTMLRHAERTVERELLYDRERKMATGERVTITFRADSGVNGVAVISLDGMRIYQIASTSMRHALSFERANRRY